MSQPHPVALVTGGAKRVGRAIALALAEAKYDVAITYNESSDEAGKVVELVRAGGGKGLAIRADLSDASSNDEIGRQVRETFGGLAVLVNNASIYEPGGMGDASLPQARRMWAVHVEAPLLLCRMFAGELRAARGSVVNMLDILAEKPMASHAVYCASKAALWNLTMSLARELAPDVTVNGIAPGVVEWPADYPQAEREKYLRRVPLGRAGTPEEVARAVLFLCAPGGYVTGQVLRLDGGRSLA